MKILITGAGGFLGCAVVRRLLEDGYRDFRCLVRDPSKQGKLRAIGAEFPDARMEIVRGNLNSPADAQRAADGIDTIFHLASAMKGSAADMVLNSVVASRNLLDAAAGRRPLRIVLVSSFGVYGVGGLGRGALVNEDTPLEPRPAQRDPYSFTKLRQELLFHEYARERGFELVVLRPGVIYGPGGGHISARVGLNLFGLFLHLGRGNRLPITYVENCAAAIVVAGLAPDSAGKVFNVHDDDLPTCRQYLRQYKQQVRKIRSIPVPYPVLMLLSRAVAWYHRRSRGQLPAIFTPYKTASTWGGNRFDNSRLKAAGWRQTVPTQEALARTFAAFRAAL